MSLLDNFLDTVKEIDLEQVKRYTGDKLGTVEEYMARTETKSEPDYVRGFVAGMIGGIIGTGVKMLVDRSLPTEQPQQEHDARMQVVEGAEELVGADLTENQEEIGQQLVNFGFGALIGGIYGVVTEGMPGTQVPAGVPFGAGLWTVAHKMALPVLGLAPSPLETKAQTQIGQLVSHVAFGATVEVVRRGVRHAMDEQDF